MLTTVAHANDETDESSNSVIPVERVEVVAIKDPDFMPYSAAFKIMRKVDAIQGLNRVRLRFFLRKKSDRADFSKVKLRLASVTVDQAVSVAPDGFVDLPDSVVANAEDALLLSNQAPGTYSMSYGPEILNPGGDSADYTELMDGMSQSTKMMKELWGFLFPSFVGISVRFDRPGQSVTLQSSRGTNQLAADPGANYVLLEYDRALYDAKPRLTFSATPSRVVPINIRPKAARSEGSN